MFAIFIHMTIIGTNLVLQLERLVALEKNRIGSADIAAVLRKDIVEGILAPHEKLAPERILAAHFSVSRGTVRAALKQLGRENLISARKGSGTYVTQQEGPQNTKVFDQARPLELMDARFAFEPHICRLAVLNARGSDLTDLENLLVAMESSVEDAPAFSINDTRFHTRLVQITGNPLLNWIAAQMTSVRSKQEWMRMRNLTLEREIITRYNFQHRAIVDAVRNREPERAAALMKEHLETARLSLTRASAT